MKIRLDQLLVQRGFAETRSKAGAIILAGSVMVRGIPVTKAGTAIEEDSEITVKSLPKFVSRAGAKLEAALDAFSIDVTGSIAIDIGASTGGFIDLMLQRGALKVFAVDVGHNQLHWKLRSDERVVTLEGVNARLLDPDLIGCICDIATFDVSFISLKLVIPPVLKVLKTPSRIVALIKPQFEAGKEHIGKGGLLKNLAVAQEIIHDMKEFLSGLNCEVVGTIPSPVKGVKGNQEYLVYALYKGER